MPRRGLGFAALLALALTGAAFLIQRRIDFNVADEGYLWYGATRTGHGGVPLRDFSSYDPGRYYWAAAWARLLGDGLLALRLSTAVFQALGLLAGLLAASRVVARRWTLAAVGLLLVLWMVPRHKLFEPSLAMAAVWIAALLLEEASDWRLFAAGALIGVGGVFGKNHGLYCLLAFSLLLLYLRFRVHRIPPELFRRRLLFWVGGIAAGLSPVLAMMLAIPGFAHSYFASFLFFLRQGRTNFPVPFPWPWLALAPDLNAWERCQRLSLGLAFLLIPAFCGIAAVVAWKNRREGGKDAQDPRTTSVPEPAPMAHMPSSPPRQEAREKWGLDLLLAGAFVGLFYAHHSFSRTDVYHLAQSIHPVLLGLVALPAALPACRRRLAVAVLVPLLAFVTLCTAVPQSPLFKKLAADPADAFVRYNLAGETLLLSHRDARVFQAVEYVVHRFVPRGEPILIVAHVPGLYQVLGRESPVWDIYPLWPAQGEPDLRMLRELQEKKVRWALVLDFPMPGSEELRFAATHPAVWSYLMTSFERIRTPQLGRHYWLLHLRSGA